jgi:phospholipase/carboxylesterase
MAASSSDAEHPHREARVIESGAPLADARAAVLLFHGRGASAQGMLAIGDEIGLDDVAYLAPQAHRRTWYPQSFLAPIDANEPHLTSALQVVDGLVDRAAADGPGLEHTVLLGFSQGACLATEYAARTPRRYGGVVGLSGGLIGPENDPPEHEGDLEGTPVFLGCSDRDPYIPLERVEHTAEVLEAMNAAVTTRIYEGMGHTTNDDELRRVRTLVARCAGLDDAPSGSPLRPSSPAGDEGQAQG